MRKVNELVEQLYEAKLAENEAKAKRELLEEELSKELKIPDTWEGSKTQEVDVFKFTVKRSMNVKIDDAKLRSMLEEDSSLSAAGAVAFRWKAELNKKMWNGIEEDKKAKFSEVITKTPGKIGITVEFKKTKEAA